jgi:hypothetical protein
VQVIIGGYTAEMGGRATGVRSMIIDRDQTNHLISVFGRGALPPTRPQFEFASPNPACIVLGTR